MEAKEAFERYAATHGVTVKHYHADNGRFADVLFKEHVQEKGQTISFCGVGAHHQNGKVEKRIRDLTEAARTMLLHAAHRWPQAVTANLWPYALHHAARLRNNLSSNPSSPLQLFTKASYLKSKVQDRMFWKSQHTFGCPVFVLDAPLQGSVKGKKKWSERSRVGIYLGQSKEHAHLVALVLNPKTGHVSPQFHVVFDDTFDTVKQGVDVESLWQDKAALADQISNTFHVDTPVTSFAQPWFHRANDPEALKGQPEPNQPVATPPSQGATPSQGNSPSQGEAPSQGQPSQGTPSSPAIVEDDTPSSLSEGADSSSPFHSFGSDHPASATGTPRRSPRLAKQPRRSARLSSKAQVHPLLIKAHFVRLGLSSTNSDGTLNEVHPLVHAFASSIELSAYASSAATGDPDTMHLGDALKQPDWKEFRKAMDKEVQDFTEREHWELVPATIADELKSKGVKFDIIQAVWSYK